MSTDKVVIIIAVSIACALVCAWQVRRALREPLERARIVCDEILSTVPPARETEPGTDVVLQDHCELVWSMPEYVSPETAAGIDRLHSAVRDEQEGESA